MKIESKRIWRVGDRESESREAAEQFAEYGGYGELIEPYLEARGYNDAETQADLTARTRVVNALVDYFRFVDEQDEPEFLDKHDKKVRAA